MFLRLQNICSNRYERQSIMYLAQALEIWTSNCLWCPIYENFKIYWCFTPEPWQGYGFDNESKKILDSGNIRGQEIKWGDTHHPNFSEKNGEYAGDYLFINIKQTQGVCY